LTTVEVVVVGGGPAGVAAAVAAATAGAEVLLVDEAPEAGGQIYRQLPTALRSTAGDPLAVERGQSQALLEELTRARVTVWSRAEVWGVFRERVLAVYRNGRSTRVEAGALVLATGAYDRPVAFPGWTLPGVVTAGGTTALIKGQRILPGRRVLLAGTGPLLLAAAVLLVRGGAEVVGIAEAGTRAGLAGLLRRPGLAGRALETLAALRGAGVPLWARHGVVRTDGDGQVTRATIAQLDESWRALAGTERTLDVDTVCVGYGLIPSTELAQLAGCAVAYRPGQGGWVPEAASERLMATSVRGVFVAGDGAGIGGVEAAREQGQLAGLGAAAFVGRLNEREAAAKARLPRRRLQGLAGFRRSLERLLAPRPGLADLVTDETVVCRCEEVTGVQVRAAIADGARHVTEVRAATRCGMGLCQGRMCAPTVAALIATSAGVSPEAVGRLTARPPVRPVPVAALADEALGQARQEPAGAKPE
jgi:thioredoxin reductase